MPLIWKTSLSCSVGALLAASGAVAASADDEMQLNKLPQIAEVDERFQSYNVEMVEVTGGQFWAPYGGPMGEQYRQRPPEDLSDSRLRALTRHLGPAYMRVSGTWANSTYLEAEGEHLEKPPQGYNQILTRQQWRGVIDFARAVDAKVGVSFAVSEGPRGSDSVWKTEQAQRLLDLTHSERGELGFAEFINEPNAASLGRLPKGYSVANYSRDFEIFRNWARQTSPRTKIVGPGGVGEGGDLSKIPVATLARMLLTEELMKANPNTLDAVSYHFYGGVSQRCANTQAHKAQQSEALTPAWLDLTLRDWKYYSGLRDKYEPGDPMWVTETAQAACGGSPWAASFRDTFRYVNQLGLLAQKGVRVVFHNTLTASDYSLIEELTKTPRPNYWAAVLWRRTMGTKVLASPLSPSENLRLYAHCMPEVEGGIGLAAINLGSTPQTLNLGKGAQVWLLEAPSLDSTTVTVNGRAPLLQADGSLAGLKAAKAAASVRIPEKSVAYITQPRAGNAACMST